MPPLVNYAECFILFVFLETSAESYSLLKLLSSLDEVQFYLLLIVYTSETKPMLDFLFLCLFFSRI